MINNEQKQEEKYIKEYSKMGISAVTPITLVVLAEILSGHTKVGCHILYALAAISSLYTAKVFYSVFKNNSKQINSRDEYSF